MYSQKRKKSRHSNIFNCSLHIGERKYFVCMPRSISYSQTGVWSV